MNEPIIDTAVLDELKDTAGADFVVELVDTFLEEAPQMLAEMRAAQAAGDAERYRRAAHSLKSNSQTFGAVGLGAAARAQELGGLPADGAPVDALQAAFDAAARALQELTRG